MNAIMLMNHYEAPLVAVLELFPEGLLCSSSGTEVLEENDGLW